MYFHVKQLKQMLIVYNTMECIEEILIINNNKDRAVDFNMDKVRVIGTGDNMYVNPSWKYGVENAKCSNVILANDDITLMGDLSKLLKNVSFLLKEKMILGPNATCFPRYKSSPVLKFFPSSSGSKYVMNYGFGVFMIMKKETFLNTKIPDNFLVWYGDHVLYLKNTPWEFAGITIATFMAGTTSKLKLNRIKINERKEWHKYIKTN